MYARIAGLILSGLVASEPVTAEVMQDTNVALNATVTLNGTFFQGGYPNGTVVAPSTVVDGIFLPQYTYWQQGGVWWDQPVSSGQNIVIDLNGTFNISAFTVQVDDNDAYRLFYRNGSVDPWHLAWDVPSYNFYNGTDLFGMQNRPDPYSDAARYVLPSTIWATDLMIMGAADSDTLYSVSEIQAFGRTPEPGFLLLFGAGLIGAFAAKTCRRSG